MTATKPSKPKYSLPFFDAVAYVLSEQRRINVYGEIGASTLSHISNSLNFMLADNKTKPINMHLNSQGGSVIDGLAIYDTLKMVGKKTPVHITVTGSCMSMATIILQAATKRLSYPNSEFLLHELRYGRSGSYTEQEDYVQHAQKLQDKLNAILIARTNITEAELIALIKRKDYTISAQEALQHGLIDAIVE